MDIVKYIIEILFEKDQVVIPGLGSFITENNSAQIHPVDHTFLPPTKTIVFDEITTDDDVLLKRISEKENISLVAAEREIRNFTDEILAKIQKNKTATIDGLGVFSINFENIITFTSADIDFSDDSFGLREFQSPAVVRNEYKEMAEAKIVQQKNDEIERKKRNRRYLALAAILVFVVVFGALFLFTNTFNPSNNKNKQLTSNDTSQHNYQNIKENQPSTIDTAKVDTQATQTNVADVQTTPIEEKKKDPEKTKKIDKPVGDTKYYIVAGSFKVEENANARVAELKTKGYPNAGVVKHYKNDLYVAYYNVFTAKDKAVAEHKKINSELDKEAWIMKK